MPNKPWSRAEIETLLSFKDHKTIEVKNRSKKSIRRKLLQLGVIKSAYKIKFHRKNSWSEEELSILRSAPNLKKVKIPNRSRAAVFCKCVRLGLIKKGIGIPRMPWKKEDVDILVGLKNQGLTPSQIAKTGSLPKYSRNGIQKKMATMLKEFSPSKLEIFKTFLKENWQGKTPQEIVALWNVSNDLKVETQDVVHHLKELKILASKEEVERVKQLKIKEEQIKKKKTTSSVATTELLRLARVDVMQQRISERKDIWTGLPLEGEDLSEIVLLS